MPAVEAETLALPRIERPDLAAAVRPVLGVGGVITDGATQWMTAGAGIVHSEMPTHELLVRGGLFHGTQLWVNLPADKKWSPPRYQDIRGSDVLLLSSHDGASLVRVIAGDLGGHAGPGRTHTPIVYAHASIAPGARLELPWPSEFNALAYVLSGRGTAGIGRVALHEGQLAIFGPGDALAIAADEQQTSRALMRVSAYAYAESHAIPMTPCATANASDRTSTLSPGDMNWGRKVR